MGNIKIDHREVINTDIRNVMSFLKLGSVSRIVWVRIKGLSMKRFGLKSVTTTLLIHSNLITIQIFCCVKVRKVSTVVGAKRIISP